MTAKYEMENALSPGRITRVDADKFHAMKDAMLFVLPTEAPGLTEAEIRELMAPILSQEHFPNGEKAGWWRKGVQLDLEAKGVVHRTSTKPLRFYQNAGAGLLPDVAEQ